MAFFKDRLNNIKPNVVVTKQDVQPFQQRIADCVNTLSRFNTKESREASTQLNNTYQFFENVVSPQDNNQVSPSHPQSAPSYK